MFVFCAANFSSAPIKQLKTVEDFYMALLARYVSPRANVKDRRKLIQTSDVSRAYLYLSGENALVDWEGWAEIALFKKTGGEENALLDEPGVERRAVRAEKLNCRRA